MISQHKYHMFQVNYSMKVEDIFLIMMQIPKMSLMLRKMYMVYVSYGFAAKKGSSVQTNQNIEMVSMHSGKPFERFGHFKT